MAKKADINEQLSILALTRVQGMGVALLRSMLGVVGSATQLMANIADIHNILPDARPQLIKALSDRTIIDLAKREMDFITDKGIKLICIGDEDYPVRLQECDDAPIALYTLGNADFNAKHIVSIVGTRRATQYGKDICGQFVADLAKILPGTLVVSGLAYGIDVCAHRAAIAAGLPTVGVLAHGLDRIYPSSHRTVAKTMLDNGGLLTEFMSGTDPLRPYFLQRNRIVAGLADATIVVESASSGGSLFTASLAQGYARDCFAFPGRVNDQYSCGCNELICRNKAALITSAYDFAEAMNWGVAKAKRNEQKQMELFPELSAEELSILKLLQASGDALQLNRMVIELDMPVNHITPLLFELEMKGLIKAAAGGSYRLLINAGHEF